MHVHMDNAYETCTHAYHLIFHPMHPFITDSMHPLILRCSLSLSVPLELGSPVNFQCGFLWCVKCDAVIRNNRQAAGGGLVQGGG